MSNTEKTTPNLLTIVLVAMSLSAFFGMLLFLMVIHPEPIENAVSNYSAAFSGLLIGIMGALFARSNLDHKRFLARLSPGEKPPVAIEKMSLMAKMFLSVSMVIVMVSLMGLSADVYYHMLRV